MRLLSSAAVICAALFSGTILHAQDPELLAKRQCRSVHINQQGHPSQASALYNVVKAKTSVPGTYFCAMNFDDGYIGFQEQSNGKKVIIFSIWDPVAHGDNPNDVPEEERTKLVKLGKDARSRRTKLRGLSLGNRGEHALPRLRQKNGEIQGNQRLLL